METLVTLNHDVGITVVFVSHDADDRRYARHAMTLADGRIVENTMQAQQGTETAP